jgi:hypothetical protein
MMYIKTYYTLRVGEQRQKHIQGGAMILNNNLVIKMSYVFRVSGMYRQCKIIQVST